MSPDPNTHKLMVGWGDSPPIRNVLQHFLLDLNNDPTPPPPRVRDVHKNTCGTNKNRVITAKSTQSGDLDRARKKSIAVKVSKTWWRTRHSFDTRLFCILSLPRTVCTITRCLGSENSQFVETKPWKALKNIQTFTFFSSPARKTVSASRVKRILANERLSARGHPFCFTNGHHPSTFTSKCLRACSHRLCSTAQTITAYRKTRTRKCTEMIVEMSPNTREFSSCWDNLWHSREISFGRQEHKFCARTVPQAILVGYTDLETMFWHSVLHGTSLSKSQT